MRTTNHKGVYLQSNGKFAAAFYYGDNHRFVVGQNYELELQAAFFLQYEIIEFDKLNPTIEIYLRPSDNPLRREIAAAKRKANAIKKGRFYLDQWKNKNAKKRKK